MSLLAMAAESSEIETNGRTLRKRLNVETDHSKLNCNVKLQVPLVLGLGRTALKDMPPSNKESRTVAIGQLSRMSGPGKLRPKQKKLKRRLPSPEKLYYRHSRVSKSPRSLKASRASYRLHLKTKSPEKREKRINNTHISRTVELIQNPFECGQISTKLLFLASLNLCPKPGVIIAPKVLVTKADPVLVEKIRVRQEKERIERMRIERKLHQERMERLISIKNRGLLYPPKPIELVDLASDDDEDCKVVTHFIKPSKGDNLRKTKVPLLSHMLQSKFPFRKNGANHHGPRRINLSNPAQCSFGKSQFTIPAPSTNIGNSTITAVDNINPYDILSLESSHLDSSHSATEEVNVSNETSKTTVADECPDFILGDIDTDAFVNPVEPPDGNNNLSDSVSMSDMTTEDFNPQDFVAAFYDNPEEEVILID